MHRKQKLRVTACDT